MSPRLRADLPMILLMLALVAGFALVTSRYAGAQTDLPGGVTCEQVVEYARMLDIPNTRRGRAQARMIASTLGIEVTDAQLDAAAKCLRMRDLDDRYGCTPKQASPNGECQ